SLHAVKVLRRTLLLSCVLLLAASAPWSPPTISRAQTPLSGRILAANRGQVAWLDLLAPRPTPLTQLVRPAYPADVAAPSSGSFAVASVVSALANGGMGGDLVLLDLQSATSRTLLARLSDAESLDVPALWPDGSGVVYQRSNLRAVVPMPGQ